MGELAKTLFVLQGNEKLDLPEHFWMRVDFRNERKYLCWQWK